MKTQSKYFSARAVWCSLVLLAPGHRPGHAQGSPYIQLDDPRLARFELLVDRGVIPDPTPLVRPFTEAQAVAALRSLSPKASASDSAQAASLLKLWTPPDTMYWGRVDFALGAQAYTHAARDPVHPAGDGGVWPFGSIEFLGVFGPVVTHAELYGENRLRDDPYWPANITGATLPTKLVYRYPVAYIGAQWKPAELSWGRCRGSGGRGACRASRPAAGAIPLRMARSTSAPGICGCRASWPSSRTCPTRRARSSIGTRWRSGSASRSRRKSTWRSGRRPSSREWTKT